MSATLTLSNLPKGVKARVAGYTRGNPAYRARLLALGLTRGVVVEVVNLAPLGDPIEISVRGFRLSLRRSEAAVVEVERV
ncbi:MAG: FeoA family protein [Kiritimatiellia bacterium]|jgi:Fe2+ transport system protein FeoA